MKQIKRLFSSGILPWKFSNSKAYELPLVNPELNLELLEEKEDFIFVYDQILKSYENQDIDWLKEVTEPKLYNKLQSGIQEIKANEQRIKIVNEKEETNLTYHNALLYWGAYIDRSKNKDAIMENKEFPLGSPQRVSNMIYFGYESYAAILKVEVIFASNKKLLLLDKSDNIIEGDNNENLEYHKFQFEKMCQYRYSASGITKLLFWNGFLWKDPFKDSQWIITDLDDSLDGNPISG